jgi:peroxiredoxin
MTTRRDFFLQTLAALPAATALGTLAAPAAAQAATLPRPAGSLPYEVNGMRLNLSHSKGSPTILEVILTTCPHCQTAARIFDKIYREKSAQGLKVIGLAINDNPDIPGFVRNFGISFPIGTVKREDVYAFLQIPMMSARILMPQVALIDRGGNIVAQYAGDDPLFGEPNEETKIRTAVEKILPAGRKATPAAAKKPNSKKPS